MADLEECYLFCCGVNSQFGCPPVSKNYCGQFDHLIDLWKLYGKHITLSGNTWYYKGELKMSFSGWRFFSSWPIYELSYFLTSLDTCVKERSDDG